MSDISKVITRLKKGHRQLVVLSGNEEWCVSTASRFMHDGVAARRLWLGQAPDDVNNKIRAAEAGRFLGQEFDRLVVNTFSGLDVDAFGACSGTVTGGGLLIMLTPPLNEWSSYPDPEHRRITVSPHDYKDVAGNFLGRLAKIINQDKTALLISEEQSDPLSLADRLVDVLEQEQYKMEVRTTSDQLLAIEAIQKVALGHRRRPLVITSDRGRGKTAALGMAAAKLLEMDFDNICITASSFDSVATAFRHAHENLDGSVLSAEGLQLGNKKFSYIHPAALLENNTDARFLLVDEAASIPAGILEQLLGRFSRIVFATTVHGYEGTGRGFAIRFNRTLDRITPKWRAIRLEQPVRWASNDPLEKFIFRALLLNAKAVTADLVEDCQPEHAMFRHVTRKQLLENDELLSQVFGLLVNAHYRTRPFDLRCMLDCFDLDILVLEYRNNIVGTVLMTYEGMMDEDTAEAVLNGRRWPQGHLLAETLTANCGFMEACTLKCARIMRIAIHPSVQKRGLGSQLVRYCIEHAASARCDYLGTSFAIDNDLVKFWYNNGFTAARISISPDRQLGSQSVMLTSGITPDGRLLAGHLQTSFARKLAYDLLTSYRKFHPLTTHLLLQSLHNQDIDPGLGETDIRDINMFVNGSRNINTVMPLLWRLMIHIYRNDAIDGIDITSRNILISLIMQGHDTSWVVQEYGLQGREHLIQVVKKAILILITKTSIA